jgi:predicted ATPase
MALYARSGQRAAALRQYGECERVLQEELGVPPSPETVELYEAIRAGRELSPDLPEAGAAAPEPFSSHRHNLRVQLTPFVGRENELAELSDLLAPTAEARLVTVVGPGGMGKTRLALEAASRQLDHYPDGVWFASLAPVQSTEAIVPAITQVLGVSFHGTEPPRQQLIRYLREKRMLLMLDNLEHLLEGVDFLIELLRAAPGVRLLVTSRVRLNARGEQVITLQGMGYPKMLVGVPGADDLRRYDSVALFARSARRARSGFELTEKSLPHVAHICQLVQGMPLAILLAAAWVPALTPAEIAAEMERSLDFLAAEWRDEPERHHSMRAVFDATWEMLTEDERQAYARLSVFRGGFTREAAQAVAGIDLRTLVSLVNKSLLQRDRSGRYGVHELLRQYAEARLDERPAEKGHTLDLHCATYVAFVQCREMEAWKGKLQAFLTELDNVRAAWQHAIARRRVADILSLLHCLSWPNVGFWPIQEEVDLCAQAVATLRHIGTEVLDQEGKVALGMALALQGHFRALSGDVDRGGELIRESLAILRGLGPRRELALCLNIAVAHEAVSDPAERSRLLDQALVISTDVGDYQNILWATNLRARQALVDGAVREAEEGFRQVLALSRQLGSQSGIGMALIYLGHAAFARGQYARAREYYAQGLATSKAIGQGWSLGRVDQHLGDVAVALKKYEAAAQHYAQALTSYQDIGVTWYWIDAAAFGGCYGVPVMLQALGDVALAVGDVDLARQHYQQALEGALDHPSEEPRLHLLLGPGRLLAQEGDVERAAEVVALARHHPASIKETRDKAGELLDELQLRLSPEAYAAVEARGRARDLEATVRELLEELHA